MKGSLMLGTKKRVIVFLIALLWGLSVADKLLAQEDVSFIARKDFAVGRHPMSVVAGDFNRDGITDLATAIAFPPKKATA
jgi:hypothetical protein